MIFLDLVIFLDFVIFVPGAAVAAVTRFVIVVNFVIFVPGRGLDSCHGL